MSGLENKSLDISKFRACLAEAFKTRRKFMIDKPDDPIDFYYSIINAIHSHFIVSNINSILFYFKFQDCPSNETSDLNCKSKCFSHKNLWFDLGKRENCSCGAKSKRLFSYHNYIVDIPLDSILSMAKSTNIIEMDKSIKLKSGKISKDLIELSDLKEKLFLYFRRFIESIQTSCPNIRCNIQSISKSYMIGNNPSYLMFSLSYSKETRGVINLENNISLNYENESGNNNNSIKGKIQNNDSLKNYSQYDKIITNNKSNNRNIKSMDILKSLVMIPKLFELASLFEHSSKNKIFYELVGVIGTKNNLTNICFYKTFDSSSKSWVYYEDENIIPMSSYFSLISFCLNNSIIPLAIQYKAIEDKYSDSDTEISFEDMGRLESYAESLDNHSDIYKNRLRPIEDLFKEKNVDSINDSGILLGGEDSINKKTKNVGSMTSINQIIYSEVKDKDNSIKDINNIKGKLNDNLNDENVRQQRIKQLNLVNYNSQVAQDSNNICVRCLKQNFANNKFCSGCGDELGYLKNVGVNNITSNIDINYQKNTANNISNPNTCKSKRNSDKILNLDDLQGPGDETSASDSKKNSLNNKQQIQSNLKNNKLNDYGEVNKVNLQGQCLSGGVQMNLVPNSSKLELTNKKSSTGNNELRTFNNEVNINNTGYVRDLPSSNLGIFTRKNELADNRQNNENYIDKQHMININDLYGGVKESDVLPPKGLLVNNKDLVEKNTNKSQPSVQQNSTLNRDKSKDNIKTGLKEAKSKF